MSGIINYFTGLPFEVRVVIALFLFTFVIWRFLGKNILWILSIIPFLLQKIYIGVYLLIQNILSALHKKVGWIFGEADSRISDIGEKIDNKIRAWHGKWKKANKPKFKNCFLAFVIGCVIIIIPSYIKTDNRIIKAGERGFLICEDFFLEQVNKCKWYDAKKELTIGNKWFKTPVASSASENGFETTLIVAGLNSMLLVRDIPSVENSVVLERLYNDDCVTWNGEIAFSYVDNRVEPWAKIIMQNGTTGWSRMDYLYPLEYDKKIYMVTNVKMN